MKQLLFSNSINKLIVVCAVVIFLCNILVISNIRLSYKNISSIYNDRVICLKQLKDISDCYNINIIRSCQNAFNSNISREKALNEISNALLVVSKNWTDYLNTYFSKEEKKEAVKLSFSIKKANEILDQINSVLRLGQDNGKVQLENLLNSKLKPSIDQLTFQINVLVDIQLKEAGKLRGSSERIYGRTVYLVILACVTLLFILILIYNRNQLINQLKIETRERKTAIDNLHLTNEELFVTNKGLKTANEKLGDLQNNLELIVKQRTTEINKLSFLFEELILNTTDSIFFIDVTPDKKFRYTRFNPAIGNDLKLYDSGLGKGKLVEELFKPDEAAYFNGRYYECLESGKPLNYEEFLGINNQNTYWNTTLIPIKNRSYEIESIIGVARNITKEKGIENALRESEHKYKTLFDKMMDGFVLYEPYFDENGILTDFRYMETNPAFDIHSYVKSESCLGKTFREVHINAGRETIDHYKEVFETGIAQSFETHSEFYKTYYIVNAYKPTENRIASIFQDITSKKKAELLLASSNASLQAIINSSPAAIINIDFEGKVCSVWNPAAEKIFGWSKEEAVGKFIPFIPDIKLKEFNALRDKIFKGNPISNMELQGTRKDGNGIFINLASAPICGNTNHIEHIIAIVTDITEQKKMEAEIAAKEKEMQQHIYEAIIEVEENERRKLASDLHDEIGPQLASMRMYTSSLKRSESDDYTKDIHNTLMELILKSISGIREISHNLTPATLERFGIVNAINAECDMIQALLPVTFVHNIKNIRFNNKIEIVIYRIIKELLNNTKKHTRADKTEIKLNLTGDLLILEYTDNGQNFNYSEIMKSGNKGMGLLNIEMRVNSINGTSKFSNTPDGGFCFNMQVTV